MAAEDTARPGACLAHCSPGWKLLLCEYNEASPATPPSSTKGPVYSSCELMPRLRGRRAPTLAHKTRPPSRHVLHSTHPIRPQKPPLPPLRAPRPISPSGLCLRSSRVQAHHSPSYTFFLCLEDAHHSLTASLNATTSHTFSRWPSLGKDVSPKLPRR